MLDVWRLKRFHQHAWEGILLHFYFEFLVFSHVYRAPSSRLLVVTKMGRSGYTVFRRSMDINDAKLQRSSSCRAFSAHPAFIVYALIHMACQHTSLRFFADIAGSRVFRVAQKGWFTKQNLISTSYATLEDDYYSVAQMISQTQPQSSGLVPPS